MPDPQYPTWDSPQPRLKWDTPGLRYGQPLPDSITNPNQQETRMSTNIKAVVDFSGYTGKALGPVALQVYNKMTANAAVFTAPPSAMPAFKLQIDDFNQKLAAKASGATADTIAFNIS